MSGDQEPEIEDAITRMRSGEQLRSFVGYCFEYPQLRFWQALLGWSELPYLVSVNTPPGFWPEEERAKYQARDTFYWEGRNE